MKPLWIGMFIIGLVAMPLNAQSESRVPSNRLARLSRGIQLPFRFWYPPESLDSIDAYYSVEDFEFLHSLGFTFVRMPIDLEFILDTTAPDLLRDEHLAIIDQVISRLMAADLLVMVDISNAALPNTAGYSGQLEDPTFFQFFKSFWRGFATHLSEFDPDYVVIEPINEPQFADDDAAWEPLQAELIQAIRKAAPEHTIIATSAGWSNPWSFVNLTPLRDDNIIYNFHFYEPFTFTHQGLDWVLDEVRALRDVPYPSSPEAVQSAYLTFESEEARTRLANYGAGYVDAAQIEAWLLAPIEWGQTHNIPILVNEIAIYSPYAPIEDRDQWYRDVLAVLEAHGIGWALWEYHDWDTDGLIFRQTNGRIAADPHLAAILGLNVED